MDDALVLRAFLTSLGIGLLIGLERERAKARAPGLRSFSLVALTGTTAALLATHGDSVWVIAAPLIAIVAIAIASYRLPASPDAEPSTTTPLAMVLCYLLGVLAGYGYAEAAVGVAVATTALLYYKPELHDFSRKLSSSEMRAILQFAAVAFLVLPLLPDRVIGPLDVINPFRIGLLVTLISGLSLAGYAALRLLDHRRAVAAMGVLGGTVSSTATTLAFSRHHRDGVIDAAAAAQVVILANLTVLVRLTVIAAAAAPSLVVSLTPVLGASLVVGAIVPVRNWWRAPPAPPGPGLTDVRNPAELGTALGFAVLFTLVLLASAAMQAIVGIGGLFAVAGLSGLTDVDAISLSAMQLLNQHRIDSHDAIIAICIAYAANLLFKLGTVAVIGGTRMAGRVAVGFAFALAGMIAAVLLL